MSISQLLHAAPHHSACCSHSSCDINPIILLRHSAASHCVGSYLLCPLLSSPLFSFTPHPLHSILSYPIFSSLLLHPSSSSFYPILSSPLFSFTPHPLHSILSSPSPLIIFILLTAYPLVPTFSPLLSSRKLSFPPFRPRPFFYSFFSLSPSPHSMSV
jgi:hypothetical protein